MFSADVVASTAQRYTGDFHVEVSEVAAGRMVRLSSVRTDMACDQMRARFLNDALDERLRERVRSETGDLQLLLIRAALQGMRDDTGTP
jgi:His-Xaa-Ser system protein HxsD